MRRRRIQRTAMKNQKPLLYLQLLFMVAHSHTRLRKLYSTFSLSSRSASCVRSFDRSFSSLKSYFRLQMAQPRTTICSTGARFYNCTETHKKKTPRREHYTYLGTLVPTNEKKRPIDLALSHSETSPHSITMQLHVPIPPPAETNNPLTNGL